MTLHWDLDLIAVASGGINVGNTVASIQSVSTDSRSIEPRSLFVALRGERFDGHDFAEAAMRNGAAAVMVEPGLDVAPRVEVADTSVALRDLAARRRSEIAASVVAITGSTGKTSTKDLLAAALPGATASVKSYNNEVGVPLTVLGTPGAAIHLVLEVGSRGLGDITWLMPAMQPDVAVITNLGVVHLETFGSEEALADAKWELMAGLGPEGTAVLPEDEPRLRRPHPGPTVTFGMSATADISVAGLHLDDDARPTFDLHTPSGSVRLRLAMAGAHQALNAAAATAAGLAVGVALDTMVPGLERARGSAWRMEIHRGRYTVVNDAYNANPDSVRAALQTVTSLPGRHHVAVLGKMAELGQVEAEEHRRMGAEAARLGYAAVVTVGDDPGYAAGAGDLAIAADDVAAARQTLEGLLGDGDVVLVKGSRTVGLETLAHYLIEAAGS